MRLIRPLFFLLLLPILQISADSDVEKTKQNLRKNFSELRLKIEDRKIKNPQIEALLKKLDEHISFLNKIKNDNYDDLLTQVLESNAELFQELKKIKNNENSIKDAIEILKDIEEDLSLKVDSVTKQQNFTSTGFVKVKVMVNVMSNTKKLSGYYIECSPKRFRKSKPMFPFNKATPDTTIELHPGIYTFWVRDKNKNPIAEREDSRVEYSETSSLNLDILLPSKNKDTQ